MTNLTSKQLKLRNHNLLRDRLKRPPMLFPPSRLAGYSEASQIAITAAAKRKLPDDTTMIELLATHSVREIAALYGCSRQCVYDRRRVMREAGKLGVDYSGVFVI